jgi:hypothetical protein
MSRSGVGGRAGAPDLLVTEGGDQFERGSKVGNQRRLGRNPRLGIEGRRVDDLSFLDPADDDAAIDEEQQDRDATGQRCRRPVARTRKVVLQANADVPGRFLDQRLALLVVAVATVMRQSINPLARKVSDG